MDDSKEEKKKHKIEEEEMETPSFAKSDLASEDKEETEEKKDRNEDEKIEENDKEEDDEVEEEKNGDDEDDKEEDENVDEEAESSPTHEDIRKSDVLRRDLNQFVRDHQPSYNLNPKSRLSGKLVTLILFILTIAVIGGAIYFVIGVGSPKKQEQTVISPPTSTTTPTPTPQTLNRSEWSFEVLNGGGVTGAAKKLADSLKALGYQVVRVANADKDYQTNEFFVQEDLMANIDSIVVDIKDIIKIASISGKLKDSTASARIIIGKE